MKTPKIDIIVTRHPSLVSYLRELNIVTFDTPVIEHATTADVRGKHVLGILPHHLSSLAATITEIPLRTTLADREAMQRGDLTLARLHETAGEPCTYTVSAGWSPAKFWPVTCEPHPNGRDAWVVGGDRTATGAYYLSPLALQGIVHFNTRDLAYYRDGGSYVIQGTARVDLDAWAQGRAELSHEKTAPEHAEYVKRCAEAGLEPLPWREALEIPCAVVMAIEWHDLVHMFSEGTTFGFGKPVALMQHEPLILWPNGQRSRIRLKFYNGEVNPRALGIDVVDVTTQPSDDNLREFDVKGGGTISGRCHNEATLIPVAVRDLDRRVAALALDIHARIIRASGPE